MFLLSIPVLHVSDSVAAETFYCKMLGFQTEFAMRDPSRTDPCYMGVQRDGVRLHLSSFSGDGVCGAVAFIAVDDVDKLYREYTERSVPIAMTPTDQTWGNREMYVKDADGNSLRFICDSKTSSNSK
jgi:uncharacterized glyoxalase superfamily protein PhnB